MTDSDPPLDPAQRTLGDMAPEDLRRHGASVVEAVADYVEGLEGRPVFPAVAPGTVRRALPAEPPGDPEPFAEILEDYRRWIEPNATHWRHPGFLAYFPTTGSGPGILAAALAAALNPNAMLWRTGPSATELEEAVVGWIGRMLGLPRSFEGVLTDTASTSTLVALAAARQAALGERVREEGIAGLGRLRVYASEEAHSSVDKAAVVLGLGLRGVRKIPTDGAFRMDPETLAAALAEDRAAGIRPIAVVATAGTTSTTSVDPCSAIAGVCEREGLWMHVDAAYAGSAATVPELRPLFAGWERADSIVVNPHKWLFVPMDASALLCRRMDAIREAFRVVPEYLRAPASGAGARDFMEYGFQLGHPFRALRVWATIRYFGVSGIARRIAEHCRLARAFAARVDASEEFERLAPVPFSVVCFRARPARLRGREAEPEVAAHLERLNEAVIEAVNRSGRAFLSHTRLRGRFAIRVAIANLGTEERHLVAVWDLFGKEAAGIDERLRGGGGG